MGSFHTATFRLLHCELRCSASAITEIDQAERRLGIRLPPSVREWYSYQDAIQILAEHSNDDPPIPLEEFAVSVWNGHRLLPFRRENQGVCAWSTMLDGSDDPPVYVDVDSNGTVWELLASTFSGYVHSCVWDYEVVLRQPALVEAQNEPVSPEALNALASAFSQEPKTFGWPGSVQYRFARGRQGVLIRSAEKRADWFVGAADQASLESALKTVWDLDGVGKSFYDCTEIGKTVLTKLKHKA